MSYHPEELISTQVFLTHCHEQLFSLVMVVPVVFQHGVLG